LSLTSGTNGAVTVDSGTTGAVNLGTNNNAKSINIGTGTAGNTIHIADDNTTADTLLIGSAKDSTTIAGTVSVSNGITLSGTVNLSATVASGTAAHGLCENSSFLVVTCDGLQSAYNLGNTITTTGSNNIAFTLVSSGSTSQTLTNAGTGEAFIINDTNGATNTSLDIQSGGNSRFTVNENGVLSLQGGQTTDITTLGLGNSITVQPAAATSLAGSGGSIVLKGGNETNVTTGTGGNVTIAAGTGVTAN
jgi:hypothetical protein